MMSRESAVAVKGQRISVAWASDHRGRLPAREFYQTLSSEERQKVLALFKRLAETGEISSREHFKSLGKSGGNLWEFKRFQLRFIGDYRPGGRFLVAFGLRKKRDELDDSDIKKAARILAEHDQNVREGTRR